MKTLIIEDEKLAAQRLQLLLQQYDPSIELLGILDSVEAALNWFRANEPPDLILLDIQLADGSCFEIFQQARIQTPVIFTTAFDQYALDAFKVMSIDYLLKPVSIESLSKSIDKLKLLQRTPPTADYSQMAALFHTPGKEYKSRFIGKVGQKLFFIELKNVLYFSADNKIVYLVSSDGYRYLVEHTLDLFETMLNPKLFFRVNRSAIVYASAIQEVKPYLNSRFKILIKSGIKTEDLIISRERVVEFKKWANS